MIDHAAQKTLQESSIMTEIKQKAKEVVANHHAVIQFKRSIEFVQSGTSITLDRMSVALDALCQQLFIEGATFKLNLEDKSLREKPFSEKIIKSLL